MRCLRPISLLQMDIDRIEVNASDLIPTAPHANAHRKETAAGNRKEPTAGGQAGGGGEDDESIIEYHLVIQTSKEGFNSGRRYVHRLPTKDDAYGWLSELQVTLNSQPKTRNPKP